MIAEVSPVPHTEPENRWTLARATATPLASIFGSGFLIIIPVLEPSFGRNSVFAIALVCGLAYLVGTAVRHNIRWSEGVPAANLGALTKRLSTASAALIAVAYTISVSLYLRIMVSYAFAYLGRDSEATEQLIATAVVVVLVLVGATRGFDGLANIEYAALAATIAIMGVLIVAFGHTVLDQQLSGDLALPRALHDDWANQAMLLGGILISVQGFETSRYLGNQFSETMRIRSCRLSQLISTGVYLVFVALCTPLMATAVPGATADHDLLELTRNVVPWLVLPLALIAVFSQLSAAIADLVTAVGNVDEVSRGRARERITYVALGAVAIGVIWAATTLQLVAVASRAFAVFYLVQCVVASRTSRTRRASIAFLLLAVPLLFIALFAKPIG